MPRITITAGSGHLVEAGSVSSLVKILEKEKLLWEEVFPGLHFHHPRTGENWRFRYDPMIAQVVAEASASAGQPVNIKVSSEALILPLFASPEGLAIRSTLSSHPLGAGPVLYWLLECGQYDANRLDQMNEWGREVRFGQAKLTAARSVHEALESENFGGRVKAAEGRMANALEEIEASVALAQQDLSSRIALAEAESSNFLKKQSFRETARRRYERRALATWQKRFEATHAAYVKKLQFEAPVELWKLATTRHSKAAWNAFLAFVGLACVFGGGAVLLALLFGDHLARSYVVESCVSSTQICEAEFSVKGPLITGALLFAASFAIWVLRIVNRIYVTERHLASAANEKRAFAETYLALISDQSVSRDQEAIVLAALFRPSGDGLPGDDSSGLDFSSAAIMAKLFAGPAGR